MKPTDTSMSTDELLDRLTGDLKPIKNVADPSQQARDAALWASLYALVALSAMGLVVGRSFSEFLASGPARTSALFGLLVGILFTYTATLSAFPGRISRVGLAAAALIGWVLALVTPAWHTGLGMDVGGIDCSLIVILLSKVPGALLARRISRLAPTRPGLTGLWTGIAASGYASVGISVFCPNHHPAHLLVWHIGLPILTASAVAFLWGRAKLRW